MAELPPDGCGLLAFVVPRHRIGEMNEHVRDELPDAHHARDGWPQPDAPEIRLVLASWHEVVAALWHGAADIVLRHCRELWQTCAASRAVALPLTADDLTQWRRGCRTPERLVAAVRRSPVCRCTRRSEHAARS